MSRKLKALNYILSTVITLATLFAVVYVCSINYSENAIDLLIKLIIGAVITGLLHAFAHELGHLIAGKRYGYKLSEFVVWFFKWQKVGQKTKFSFVWLGNEAGYTQMVPSRCDLVEIGFKKMTLGGITASFIFMVVGIVPLFIPYLHVWLYCIWAMLLPMGAYYFFGNALPNESYGVRNDGGVLYGIKRNDDVTKVTINMLKIQSQLYLGKTPAEVDEGLYFDLPQLPEDKLPFAMLLSARYSYYLDKGDYEKAKKTTERLIMLEEYLPKEYVMSIKTDALYNACTFDFNEEKADDYMYELEKYLNNVNTIANLRAKLCYLIYVIKETQNVDAFIKKCYKEIEKQQIKGIGNFELKLLKKIESSISR